MSEPNYVISIHPGYVLVEDPPDYDLIWSEQPRKLQAIAAACSEAGTRNVLIRGTNVNVKLTPIEFFAFGEAVGKLNLKVAGVTQIDAPQEDSRLFENAAANRGSQMQLFDNELDARDWLGV